MEILPIMAKPLRDKNGVEIKPHDHLNVIWDLVSRPGIARAGNESQVFVELYEANSYWLDPKTVEVIDPKCDPEISPVVFDATGVFAEIQAERIRQDGKWGGAHHDDTHIPADWVGFIETKLRQTGQGFAEDYRRRMIQVAALAVAAVESFDREHVKRPVRDAGDVIVVLDEADMPEIMPQFPPIPGMPEVKGL